MSKHRKARKYARRRQPGERSGPGNGENAILQDIRAGKDLLRSVGIADPVREMREFRGEA